MWNGGHAVRLGTFHQTADGWVAVRNALTALQSSARAVADAGQGGERPTVEPGAGAEPIAEPIAIVLEPTGGYALAFALWARQQPGWQAHRPHPARVRAWARRPGGRAKTDRQDALLLARFGASAQPALPVWRPRASEVSELEQLLRRRDEVKDGDEVKEGLERARRRHEQLGVRPDASTTVRASVERLLKTLQDELADLERAWSAPGARHCRASAAACPAFGKQAAVAHRPRCGSAGRAPPARGG